MTINDNLHLHEEILLLALRDKEGTIESGVMYQHAVAAALLGAPDPRRAGFHRPYGLHPLQSREARAGGTGSGLAVLDVPPVCGAGDLWAGLGCSRHVGGHWGI